ncbi:MAG: chorismate synthase [Desulfobacteraceae bacterium 4572_123]|nr:MAG: chorismate synthase [Desulfobacteraceae bacterium 4572_123]
MSSTTGILFKVTTFGESHGKSIGAVIDGCPPRIRLNESDIQIQLDRRRPGQSDLTTGRNEKDLVRILSGVENGQTLGTPIALLIDNRDHRPVDYGNTLDIPRPSHADYTYRMKYGINAASGGGRASARETAARVAAGAIAEKFLFETHGIRIVAWVSAAGSATAPEMGHDVSRRQVEKTSTRCPDPETARQIKKQIMRAREDSDSIGGIITCICKNMPAGLGEPVFDKTEARLAQAMLSIPASKGFEIGSGFAGAAMQGSTHNDLFIKRDDHLGTRTNFSGGIQGGITNGEPILFKVAFKPPATIGKAQNTVDYDGNDAILNAKGRHDPCVVPRAVPIVEAMTALVLADLALCQIVKN